MGIDPKTHKPIPDLSLLNLSHAQLLSVSNLQNFLNPLDAALSLQANTGDLMNIQLILHNMLQVINPNPLPYVQGNHSLDDLIQLNRLIDGTNTELTVDPLQAQSILENFSNLSPSLNQQPSTSSTLPCFDGEIIPGAVLDQSVKDFSNVYDLEYSFPSLVSATPERCIVNPLESFKQNNIPADAPDQSNIFYAWERFVDDEASSSLWKDILG